MAIGSIPTFENGEITQNGLAKHHAYSLLDTCVHDGHRLIMIGCPNDFKWNGKWSELPPYNDDTTEMWIDWRKSTVNKRFFWMEIDDVCQWFSSLKVCKYREGWHELRTGRFQLEMFCPQK